VNLEWVSAPTYRVMITSKVIYSGVLLPFFIPEDVMSKRKWAGLILLFLGCCVEQLGSFEMGKGWIALASLSTQALFSALGGVFFQYLVQKQPADLWIKNLFLYVWSCIVSMVYLLLFSPHQLQQLGVIMTDLTNNGSLVLIVLIAAVGGFCTSLVIKHLDVIMKVYLLLFIKGTIALSFLFSFRFYYYYVMITNIFVIPKMFIYSFNVILFVRIHQEYANFLDMVLTAILSYFVLGTALTPYLLLALFMVSVSLYLYNVKPADDAAMFSGAESKV
jgi:hypothetical protein